MARTTGSVHPRWPRLTSLAGQALYATLRGIGRLAQSHSPDSKYTRERIESLRQKQGNGETAYLLGITPSGHNTGVALVRVSNERGVELLGNHEEERFLREKPCTQFPERSLQVTLRQMEELGIGLSEIHAVVNGWDYSRWGAAALETLVAHFPANLKLLSKHASPVMKVSAVFHGLDVPRVLANRFGLARRLPVINLRHHHNHAYFSYAVSPFSGLDEPVLILVADGAGDDGAISSYVARKDEIKEITRNTSLWDSLGMMYGVLSSSLGGWPLLQSEGRFMGAAAWGNTDRLTNPFYSGLREIFHFADDGMVYLNRSLANWHKAGCAAPFTKRLTRIIGPPIPPEKMWNPDAVLSVEDIEHAPITRERVDKAAAVQLVFEDAMFHLVGHLIRKTKSRHLVLCGGTALNCVANMHLSDHFNEDWYKRYATSGHRLKLWVPPIPNDEGVAAGAAYHFAGLAGAPLSKPAGKMRHAFYCGLAPTTGEIREAVARDDIRFAELGNTNDAGHRERVADLLAFIISQDGVVGLYQGVAETGPRALGHRSILANPTNPRTLKTLNSLVKFREAIRPLAPMATLEAAQRFFELSPGADEDNFNAYNYMILTALATPVAREMIPAVVHFDGTCRVQIVRQEVDPFCHAYLRAMGRYVGAEVSVNTSLNVGAPIAQSPDDAVETLRRSGGMHGLLMIGADGEAIIAWHNVKTEHKDQGKSLRRWLQEKGFVAGLPDEQPEPQGSSGSASQTLRSDIQDLEHTGTGL